MEYVLVHGGFLGGWCWRAVATRLKAAGHGVTTPTLTGLGERCHLLTPEVDLQTHITDVVNALEFEDLHGVVLVGHSYSGFVITAVAECVPHRLSALVYVDALVPEQGRSYFDLRPPEVVQWFRSAADNHGRGWDIPCVFSPEMLGIDDPGMAEWVMKHLRPHPRRTLEQPFVGAGRVVNRLPKTYIVSVSPPSGAEYLEQAERARRLGWETFELPTGHLPMITQPDRLGELLQGVRTVANLRGLTPSNVPSTADQNI
ncbi:MAG TPA: alpha/beta hydrolase [Terriglobales bacterium]|nr:alpha/beta hydrolase [Terriglobales bacterium]